MNAYCVFKEGGEFHMTQRRWRGDRCAARGRPASSRERLFIRAPVEDLALWCIPFAFLCMSSLFRCAHVRLRSRRWIAAPPICLFRIVIIIARSFASVDVLQILSTLDARGAGTTTKYRYRSRVVVNSMWRRMYQNGYYGTARKCDG
ncbi:hypothetical protein EVAR_19650_1 [Eumeta japonica]|uniref:Uncharacterized protein n=1 Tax=Eumeta variegata TaxID=151549 RepID=A0A4C1V2P8_EUMVA|nr:hypothetical protein EVAR_19650_1 [Eumeta japonica]